MAVVLSVRALFQNRKHHQQEVEGDMLRSWGEEGDDAVPKPQWREMELEAAVERLHQHLQLLVQGHLIPVIGDHPIKGHCLVQAALRFSVIHPW